MTADIAPAAHAKKTRFVSWITHTKAGTEFRWHAACEHKGRGMINAACGRRTFRGKKRAALFLIHQEL